MYVTLNELCSSPAKRLMARLSRCPTVVLTSGLEVEFDKKSNVCTCEEKMDMHDGQEVRLAMKLMGI